VWSPGAPVKNPGKQPKGDYWIKRAELDPPDAVTKAPDPRALNTGLLAGNAVGFDVDILDGALADRVAGRIEHRLTPTPLSRIGRDPKILLLYKAATPFSKIQTPEFFFPDGSKAKVEVLAHGQQFVADGIHPDTGKPYRWLEGSPADTSPDELPVVTEQQAREIVAAVEQLIRNAGGREKEKPATASKKSNGHAGDFFHQVNTAALTGIGSWVRLLFPDAHFQPGTGAWRVSSADLGRDLEEDLSIHPSGIQDYGEEKSCTAIDVVIRYGSERTAVDAALWLCEQLRIDARELGYRPATPPPPPEPPPPEPPPPEPDPTPDPLGISRNDFYSYLPQRCYIFVPTRAFWPLSAVNVRVPPIDTGRVDDDGKAIKIPANVWIDQNQRVEQMTWYPGKEMVIDNQLIIDGGWITRRDVHCFNLYQPRPSFPETQQRPPPGSTMCGTSIPTTPSTYSISSPIASNFPPRKSITRSCSAVCRASARTPFWNQSNMRSGRGIFRRPRQPKSLAASTVS